MLAARQIPKIAHRCWKLFRNIFGKLHVIMLQIFAQLFIAVQDAFHALPHLERGFLRTYGCAMPVFIDFKRVRLFAPMGCHQLIRRALIAEDVVIGVREPVDHLIAQCGVPRVG